MPQEGLPLPRHIPRSPSPLGAGSAGVRLGDDANEFERDVVADEREQRGFVDIVDMKEPREGRRYRRAFSSFFIPYIVLIRRSQPAPMVNTAC